MEYSVEYSITKIFDSYSPNCRLYYNSKRKLWTFKARAFLSNLTKESCKHFNFSPLTRTAQKVVK